MPPRYLAPEIAALVNAPLDQGEFLARVAEPLSEQELADTIELVRWFCRRYPTPGQRLAYARRTYAQWSRRLPQRG